ncbi:MAG: hypothetical protein WEA09_02655 [Gemmatimonadota bacterium]
MLSQTQLVELYRELRTQEVLSIYANGTATDFAERKAWRTRLEQGLTRTRDGLGEDEAARAAFDKAVERIRPHLAEMDTFLPDRGWVAFATEEAVHYGRPVRAPMPDLVCWERGLRVAPYVRALKQQRVVVAVLMDSRRARIFRYIDGVLEEPADLTAEALAGDLSDLNLSKRAQVASGVRGQTATDAAQRFLEVSEERLLKRLMETLSELAGSDGLLVLGGTTEAVAHARDLVPQTLRVRTGEMSSAHVEMSVAEVRGQVEQAASVITQEIQAQLLGQVMDLANSGGKAGQGVEDCLKALRERRVDLLLLSRAFIQANPDLADHMVGTAFEQHADLEELSGAPGDRLEEEGGGVAARVRYVVHEGAAAR